MEKSVKKTEEEKAMIEKLKKTPELFRDALLSEATFTRLAGEVVDTTTVRKRQQNRVLRHWLAAVPEAGERLHSIELKYKKDWLAVDEKLSQYRDGIKTDKENFDAYFDTDRNIEKLERELKDDELEMECLAYRIGMDSAEYLDNKLPQYYYESE
jgi:hypothetical protein